MYAYDKVVSTLDQVVSTQCFKHKTKSCKTGQLVSTLDQFPENLLANMGQCADTSSGSVDTRSASQKLSGSYWDSVSTLDQVVSTLESFPEHLLGCFGTVCRH
ncbi:hypothetical protein Taro_051564 [Colocasia esculenta]|uniref:Uncharacterized protein n=1 Tax=Colocasia esculenta TaxID=4460 RepID=A0A843XGF2_COLES|nr:hypothetical protein [Colocasia esculenta]